VLKPVAIGGITGQHMKFFHTKPSLGLNEAVKLAGMYGFWREAAVERVYEEVPVYAFVAFIFVLLYFSVHGFMSSPGESRNILFLTLIFLGIFLGMVTTYIDFKPFRDNHKLTYFVLIGYAYLIPRGVDACRRFWLTLIALVAVLLYFNHMQLFLGGQLHPIDYPEEYIEAGRVLNGLEGEVVYLPWRLYMTYNWSLEAGLDGRIASPINAVTKKLVRTGCDPEFDYCVETAEQKNIRECISKRDQACLMELGVRYAVVDECARVPERYGWISGVDVFRGGCLRIVELITLSYLVIEEG